MTDNELLFITDAIKQTSEKANEWKKDYCYDIHTNEFSHCKSSEKENPGFHDWFKLA
jgi:hypothetical protein